ncbi:MAG: holo-ACP synthase [Dehalococcoidales bacterium]|nr:holo-ACP synthase [Dehalococcoidales bacterium]
MKQSHIGIDIMEIGRIENAVSRWGNRFLNRIFTGAEIQLCQGKAESLAVRFAGKEAVMKALVTPVSVATWKEIEILSGPDGEPVVSLHGQALLTAGTLGLNGFAISLSHSRKNAIALVIGY